MSTSESAVVDLATALRGRRGAREVRNSIATVAMVASVLAILIPLCAVVANVVAKGGSVISWDFVTKPIPAERRTGPGMGPAVFGTMMITATATAIAVPLGVLGAVYLNEYANNGRLARLIRFVSYVMSGVPSIVMGLFIYTIWVLRFRQSAFAGALALACLMLPIVIRSTEEMLRLVPGDLREASFALGTSRARTVCSVVLPAALPGIVSGSLLAVARAAGETAPIYVVVGAVAVGQGANRSLLHGTNTTLSAQIFANAVSPFAGAQSRAYGAALTLVVLAFTLTLAARLVTARLAARR